MRIQIPAVSSKKEEGFSLIEVLVAMLLLSVVLFAVAQTAILFMNNNLKNRVRDEAARVTQDVLYNVRSQPFDNIAEPAPNPVVVTRTLGGTTYTYNVTVTVNPSGTDFKTIQAVCDWDYGIGNVTTANGKRRTFTHTATSVVKR
jgi:prepilin-type N-terminal cleavage/methylation domain-containing protein